MWPVLSFLCSLCLLFLGKGEFKSRICGLTNAVYILIVKFNVIHFQAQSNLDECSAGIVESVCGGIQRTHRLSHVAWRWINGVAPLH